MVESKAFRSIIEPGTYDMHLHGFSKPANVRPCITINPIPAMVIFLLGLILAGHHQTSMESTMMHYQVPPNFQTTYTT